MNIQQDKIIKIIRLGFIILITLFLGLATYNSVTKNEKKIVISNVENNCIGCPNQNQCSKTENVKSCNNVKIQTAK